MDIKTQGLILQETECSGPSPIKHLNTGLILKQVADWLTPRKAVPMIVDNTCEGWLGLLLQL